MFSFEVSQVDYQKYSNRELYRIPVALLLISLVVLTATFALTGSPVSLGMDFTGGTEIHVQTQGVSQSEVVGSFPAEPVTVQTLASDGSYVLTFDTDSASAYDIRQAASNAGYEVESLSSVSPTFGQTTQKLALYGLLAAFAMMGVLVTLLFRTFIPSIAVILSAFSDVVISLAFMSIMGINLSLGTVAALLMLIGYSVDSDILLNNYILRRKGSFYDSVYLAMDTGVMMTLTSMAAMAVMAVSAHIFGVDLLASIGLVLFIGLSVDLMNTYLLNLSLLRWHTQGGKQ